MFVELSGNLSIKLNALGQICQQQSLKQPNNSYVTHKCTVLNGICLKKVIHLIHYKHLLEWGFDCVCVFTNTIWTNLSQIEINADSCSRLEHRSVKLNQFKPVSL